MSTIAVSPVVLAPPSIATTRWSVLAGAMIVQLILGTVYGYSIFWAPLEGQVYAPILTQEERAVRGASEADLTNVTVAATADEAGRLRAKRQGALKYAFAICILSFAVSMVFAGRLQDVTGPRIPALIGAVLMSVGFLLAGLLETPIVFQLAHAALMGAICIVLLTLFSRLARRAKTTDPLFLDYVPRGILVTVIVVGVALGVQFVGRSGETDNLLLLWGTIGLLAGAGIGFAYVCPIAALIKWFPRAKGLVSGLAVAGFGFGAYIFAHKTLPFSAFNFIQSHGIRQFFLVHALFVLVFVTLGALLLRNPPGGAAVAAAGRESDWRNTLRRPAFYVLWLMFFSGALSGLMVIGILAVFAGEQLVAAAGAVGGDAAGMAKVMAQGAAAVGWLAIFNAVGRIVWGLVSDRAGRTATFVAMFALQAAVMFGLVQMKTEFSLAVAAAVIGFNFGGNFALFPSATADLFGARNLGANYGLLFTSYGVAGVVGIYAGNTAKIMTGSYGAAFALAGVLCALSGVLAIGLHVARARRTQL